MSEDFNNISNIRNIRILNLEKKVLKGITHRRRADRDE